MDHMYFTNSVEIVLCKLTYDYIKKIGFDLYWIIHDKKTGFKHLYPICSESNLHSILKENNSHLISTDDKKILEDIKNELADYILHLPEEINKLCKGKSL
jgi:hypothetical protein